MLAELFESFDPVIDHGKEVSMSPVVLPYFYTFQNTFKSKRILAMRHEVKKFNDTKRRLSVHMTTNETKRGQPMTPSVYYKWHQAQATNDHQV